MTGHQGPGPRTPSHRAPLPEIKTAEDFGRAFDVSRETCGRLVTYVAMLKEWQKTINLVAPGTLGDIWYRHVADSAQLLALAPPEARHWIDLGSGAGFPGIVLAILLRDRSGARMTLVESDTRKAAFLRAASRAAAAPVDILCMRIEKVATQSSLGIVDVVTARALAPLPRLLSLCRPLMSEGTVALLPKGREAEAELVEARERWSFEARLEPSRTDPEGRVVVVRHLQELAGG